MRRPSSTSRFPSASDSPKRGIIHSSGVSRRARRSSSICLALVVLPAAGSPTMTKSVGGFFTPAGVKNPPTLFVMVGLPAAGKTTRAKQIEEERRALRLTPDEWMIPLFGESEADGKRDVLEGRLIWLALQVLENDIDVVLDFGLWSRDERSALRSLAASTGASCDVVYLEIDET